MTLIEVMVALLVTTVALLGALATVGATIRGSNYSRNATEASVLVQSRLEAMISMPASTVTSSSPADGVYSTETTLDANGRTNTTNGVFTRVTTWSTINDTTGLRRVVSVTVSWNDGMGSPHSVSGSRQKDPSS